MKKAAKFSLIGCGGILALFIILLAVIAVVSSSGKAAPHKFDSFELNPDACIGAFYGSTTTNFTHIWIFRSPDLKAWWDPNGMRAEAEWIVDSDDPVLIDALLACGRSSSRSPNHVRTLSEGRIYHAQLFDEANETYAHLRFAFRSKQSDGTTVFSLTTEHDGAKPIKDCAAFLEFEKQWLIGK